MKKLLLGLFIVMSANLMAATNVPLSDLGSLVEMQIRDTSLGLDAVSQEVKADKEWFLKVIRLRVRPSIGVEIEWLAKASLKPEIELFFTR